MDLDKPNLAMLASPSHKTLQDPEGSASMQLKAGDSQLAKSTVRTIALNSAPDPSYEKYHALWLQSQVSQLPQYSSR